MARVMGEELACKYMYSLVANNFEWKDMTVSIDSLVFSHYRHSLTIVVHVCFEKNHCDQGWGENIKLADSKQDDCTEK